MATTDQPQLGRAPLPPDAPRWHSGYRDAAEDEMPVAGMTLSQLLDRRVREQGQATFLVFESAGGEVVRFTYAEFADHVERLANGLAERGVGRGDRILMQLPNCPELAAALFAAGRLGAIAVPSNTANRESELAHLVRVTEPCLAVADPQFLGVVRSTLAALDSDATVVECRGEAGGEAGGPIPYEALLEAASGSRIVPEVSSLDPVQIMFSSGTTSAPKGVVLTHTNLLTSGRRQARSYRTDASDRFLTVLPLFHASAQATTLFAALVAGGSAVFLERYSARRFWDQVRAHRTTRLTLVAMLLRTLVAQPPSDTDRDHVLRSIGYATNLTEEAQQQFEERFGVTLTNAYGLTEALTEVTIAPLDGPRRWPSVGVATMDRELRIVGEDGAEVPPGRLGEIQIRGVPGETIMKEYYRDPDATARALEGGWLRTHDMGWLDEDGYLFFSDRDLDLIKVANENVSATEVEAVLLGHPDIAAAAVIGIPDSVRDEAIKAFIVPVAGVRLTAEGVQEYALQKMARFKIPSVIEFCASLPANAVGKVEKKKLREQT